MFLGGEDIEGVIGGIEGGVSRRGGGPRMVEATTSLNGDGFQKGVQLAEELAVKAAQLNAFETVIIDTDGLDIPDPEAFIGLGKGKQAAVDGNQVLNAFVRASEASGEDLGRMGLILGLADALLEAVKVGGAVGPLIYHGPAADGVVRTAGDGGESGVRSEQGGDGAPGTEVEVVQEGAVGAGRFGAAIL